MTVVALMAGTGSDDDYLRRAFGPAVTAAGGELAALRPSADVIDGYRRTLDDLAAAHGGIVVGGVSLGALAGLRWALDHTGDGACRGVLAALPPWTGEPGGSIASLSAAHTAASVENDGLDATIAAMRAGSPDWLADELERSWRALAPLGLAEQLRAASAYPGPGAEALTQLDVPLALMASTGDLLHPESVAREWAGLAPRSAIEVLPIERWGPEERLVGDACLRAWRAAGGPDLGAP
ncbi:MAG: alpha/beta hydrolase [Gordonia sp. (in: high G+C Gram-positive bacteria)]|uniref:alpha/beta hydrolase n=1 Tax=Gordonia sp. (in: high G+C Gram-positive bacteria) TaxID=84139 RepID=UPI0039E426EB